MFKHSIAAIAVTFTMLTPLVAQAQNVREPISEVVSRFTQDDFVRTRLKRKAIIAKPKSLDITKGRDAKLIVVKFVDGPKVRLPKLELDKDQRQKNISRKFDYTLDNKDRYAKKLARQNRMGERRLNQNMALVNALIGSPLVADIKPYFSQSEARLEKMRQISERQSGIQHSDMSNYYLIQVRDEKEGLRIANALNDLRVVETVYFNSKPIEEPDVAPPTPSFQGEQDYLNPAISGDGLNDGIDATYAWQFNGGDGDNITIVDIEYGWILNHEDLPPVTAFAINNVAATNPSRTDGQHGTAAVSVMLGRNDGAGVTGIVHDASLAVRGSLTTTGRNVANAIYDSVLRIQVGDLILLEQQSTDFEGDGSFVPVEYDQADFDAISVATNLGAIVIEAAGNGGNDLDVGTYDSRFDPNFRHSGAIMVGASRSNNRNAMGFSNHGERIDLHGWGQNVMSAGYGTPNSKRINGNDQTQWYREDYSGTSSASPIVAGAVAAVQGARLAAGLQPLGASSMEQLLSDTGLPFTGTNMIGEFPNLKGALDQMLPASGPNAVEPDDDPETPIDPPIYDQVITVGNVTTTSVTGDSSNSTTRLFGNNSGMNALTRLKFGERSDEPCWVKGFRRGVIIPNSGFQDDEWEECRGNNGPTNSSQKFVPVSDPANDLFIHGIEVCMSKTRNDNRIKGVKLRQSRITTEGVVNRIATSSSSHPQFERPNCKDDWRPAKLCPTGAVATDLILHHFQDGQSRSVSGIALECRAVQTENVCVENCPS